MLTLVPELLIASGGHRHCFSHPDDAKRCVKIHIDSSADGNTETQRELYYYHFIEKHHVENITVPHYYGIEETNLGTGYIFERIANADGSTAKTLEYHLNAWRNGGQPLDWLNDAWESFKTRAKNGWLITKKLHTYNMVVQEQESGEMRLIVIDNLGSTAVIPAVYFAHAFANIELNKRFTAFQKLVKQEFGYSLEG